MIDITPFMSSFLNLVVSCFSTIFNLLDSIKFFNISLLDYLIALFVLSVAVPIVVTLANGYAGNREVTAISRYASATVKGKYSYEARFNKHVDSLSNDWD